MTCEEYVLPTAFNQIRNRWFLQQSKWEACIQNGDILVNNKHMGKARVKSIFDKCFSHIDSCEQGTGEINNEEMQEKGHNSCGMLWGNETVPC